MRSTIIQLVLLPATLLFSTFVLSANIEDLRVGEMYYMPKAGTGTRVVRIAAVDSRRGLVKVLDENGVGDWIAPSVLMTRLQVENAEKRAQDRAQAAAAKRRKEEEEAEAAGTLLGLGLVACLFMPSECKEALTDGYAFRVINRCRRPVELVVSYEDMSGKWVTRGWFSFAPNQSAYLNEANGQKARTKKADWYYYARSTDHSNLQWFGDAIVVFNNERIPLQKMHQPEGENKLELTC